MHAVVLGTIAAAIGGVIWLGQGLFRRQPGLHRTLLTAWVCFVACWQVFTQVWWAWPGNFHPESSLPLHVCDLVVWTIPFAFLWHRRWAATQLYFWGVGLSIWAFFFPTETAGPADIRFWLYWLGHTQIVGSAIYLIAVLDYVPRWRDVLAASAGLLAYTAIVLPIDIVFRLDYGYVGPASEVVAWLGPWPARVGILFALEVTAFVGLWAAAAAYRGKSRDTCGTQTAHTRG